MSQSFNDAIPQVTEFLRKEANTETVVGKQFQLGAFSCVPVIRVGMGFGSGGGEGDAPNNQGHGEGVGVAGGMGIEPIGFLVSKDDQITFIPTKEKGGLSAAFEKVPGLIEKFMEQQKEKDSAKA